MGFNSGFKGLILHVKTVMLNFVCRRIGDFMLFVSVVAEWTIMFSDQYTGQAASLFEE